MDLPHCWPFLLKPSEWMGVGLAFPVISRSSYKADAILWLRTSGVRRGVKDGLSGPGVVDSSRSLQRQQEGRTARIGGKGAKNGGRHTQPPTLGESWENENEHPQDCI